MAFQRWDADEFLDEISDSQFAKWKAFAEVEPFGPFAEDQRNGMSMALLANINRDSSKRKEPFSSADFMTSQTKKREPKKLPLKVQRERMEAYLGKPNG